MPRATRQVTSEDSSLRGLKRSELQALAKVRLNGIKANGKNQVIIKSLLANKAFVDSKTAKSHKSSASGQPSPNVIEAQPRHRTAALMPPRRQDILNNLDARVERDRVQLPTTQYMKEVRRSLAIMNEDQVLLQEVVDKLRTLNEETGCILEERAEGLKKMMWTRQILEHLCVASDAN